MYGRSARQLDRFWELGVVQLSKKGASGRHLTWFNDTFPFFGGVILSTQSGQIAWGAGCFEQRCTTEPSKWKGVLFGRSGTETRHRGRRPEKLGWKAESVFVFVPSKSSLMIFGQVPLRLGPGSTYYLEKTGDKRPLFGLRSARASAGLGRRRVAE